MDTPETAQCLEGLVDDFVALLNRADEQGRLLMLVVGDAKGRAPDLNKEALGKIARAVRLFHWHLDAEIGFVTQGKEELLQPNQQAVKRQDAA